MKKILSLKVKESIYQSSTILKSCAKASIRIESNSYEYGGRPDRHSMRLYCTCAHSGEVLLLGWQARRRYSSRIDRQKGMIHEQCYITCHGCEIAIGIVALDVSRRSIPRLRQVFFSSRSKGKRYFAASSFSAAILNNAYLERTLWAAFISVFRLFSKLQDDFKHVYHLPLDIIKRKNNFFRNEYVNFVELIF